MDFRKNGFVKLVLIGLILVAGTVFYLNKPALKPVENPKERRNLPTEPARKEPAKKTGLKKSVFIPYWADEDNYDLDLYDRVIYFGVTGGIEGLNTQERGYLNLESTLEKIKTANKHEVWLTLRLTNSETNLSLLKNKTGWETLVAETVALAADNGLQGIVLDLEMSVLPTDEIAASIVEFNQLLVQQAARQNLKTAFLVYGDTFYRKRPYDIKALGLSSKEIMIMAYDFHKARGEPGPNMPLDGRQIYGYDFKQMAFDFLAYIPSDHLTVVYGMYGYDWQVDEKQRPISQAKAVTLKEIQSLYNSETCSDFSSEASGESRMKNSSCLIKEDPISGETEIEYIRSKIVNEFGYMDYHIIWSETEQSVAKKTKFLEEQGVYSIGYWTYSYF